MSAHVNYEGSEWVRVTIPGSPRGQGSMTLWQGPDGKGRAKHPAPTVLHRNLAVTCLRDAWGDRPPLVGPVMVTIDARVGRPQSHYGTGRNAGRLKQGAPWWAPVTPDLDKVARLILDAMTVAGVVRDDKQVTHIVATKSYCVVERPCTEVSIKGVTVETPW